MNFTSTVIISTVILVSYLVILPAFGCTDRVAEEVDLGRARETAQGFARALAQDDLPQMYEYMGTWYRADNTMEDFASFVGALYKGCGQPSSLEFKDIQLGGTMTGGGLSHEKPIAEAYFQMLGPDLHRGNCFLKVTMVPDNGAMPVVFFWLTKDPKPGPR